MGNNPYLLDRPAVVSFSGGRTSGFMLRQILDAFGGELPHDVLVCFQNTGLEHEATYAFVEEVEKRWGVPISWLEYRNDGDGHGVEEVEPHTANKSGGPFDDLIAKKQFLPNPVARICTANLKMQTLYRFLKDREGFQAGWTNAVGLRYDEPRRVHRLKADQKLEEPYCPMYYAKHTLEDVEAFWKASDFDLMLPHGTNLYGNCVGCFLKARTKLELIMSEEPQHFDWWIKAEEKALTSAESGASFRNDRPTYANMMKQVKEQGTFDYGDEPTLPCMCTD